MMYRDRVRKKLKLKVMPNPSGRPVRSPLCIPTTQCRECLDLIADHPSVKPEHIVDTIVDGRVRHYITVWDVFGCEEGEEPEPVLVIEVAPRRRLRFA